jgi:hypothetical protein
MAVVGEIAVTVVEIVEADADLLEIIGRLSAIGGHAHLLHGGQQQRDKHGDDRDHDQQFDQRKTAAPEPGMPNGCHGVDLLKKNIDEHNENETLWAGPAAFSDALVAGCCPP